MGKLKISGKFESDENFVTVYAENGRMYTIAKNGGQWRSIGVGERAYSGPVLTQEEFDRRAAECKRAGEFELAM